MVNSPWGVEVGLSRQGCGSGDGARDGPPVLTPSQTWARILGALQKRSQAACAIVWCAGRLRTTSQTVVPEVVSRLLGAADTTARRRGSCLVVADRDGKVICVDGRRRGRTSHEWKRRLFKGQWCGGCGGLWWEKSCKWNFESGVEVGAEWMAEVEGRRWTQAARRAPRPSGMRLWCAQSLFEVTIWGKASARDRFRIRTTGLGGGRAAVNCWESKPGDGRQGSLDLQRRGAREVIAGA